MITLELPHPDTGKLAKVARVVFADGSQWMPGHKAPAEPSAVERYRSAVMRSLRNDRARSFNDIRRRAGGDMLSTISALHTLEVEGRAVRVSRECWQAAPAKAVA